MLRDVHIEPNLMRRRPNRLRVLLWTFGLLYGGYLLAANIFLNTGASSAFSPTPQTFNVQWRWAFSLWPGHIYARDLMMRGHARSLMWSARGDAASGRVEFWPLFRREIHFGHVYASGVSLMGMPAAYDRKPPPWQRSAWHVGADQVSTQSLRQVRFDGVAADSADGGAARIGFTHQLQGGASQVYPSRIAMPDATVRYRQQLLLRDARYEVKFVSEPFTNDQWPGIEKLQRATLHLSVTGNTPLLALGADAVGTKKAHAAPPTGHLSADLTLKRGVLLPGGTLQWRVPVAVTEADGSQQRRLGKLDLLVQTDKLFLHAQVPRPVGDASKTSGTAHWIDATMHFGTRRVLPVRSASDNFKLLSAELQGSWHFASLRWLTPLTASKPWLMLDGAGDIAGNVKLKAGQLVAGSHVELPRFALSAKLLDNVFHGDAQAKAQVVADPQGDRTNVSMTMSDFTLARSSPSSAPYLRGHALQIALHSSADLLDLRDSFSGRLHFEHAQIPDLRAYNHYLPGKSLQFLQGSGQLSTDLNVTGKGDIHDGHITLQSTGTQLALGVTRLTGDLDLDTHLTATKQADHAYDLENFSLALKGVRVEGSSAPPWWGKITLHQAAMHWDRPMRLRGKATLEMKDVSLLLSLFADRSAFPQWIVNVINDGRATAHADVASQGSDFILDHLVAHNKRVALYAHLRISHGQPEGDLYARWGILGLGVALKNGNRDFHLLHAQRWYQSQPDLLPASVEH